VSIKAWLDGQDVDLECLAVLFPYGGRDFWVGQQGGRYYLSAPELDNPPEGVRHLKVAEGLVATANGYACILYPEFRPVRSLGSFSEDGKPNFAQKELTLEVRPNLSEGITAGPRPDAPTYAELAPKISPDLAEAIVIMGGRDGEPNFEQLYSICEIITRAGVLKAVTLAAPGVSEARVRLFKQTAQASRHARMRGRPPRKPMPIQEARTMITLLLVAWMNLTVR
jgi:hypothetical protein